MRVLGVSLLALAVAACGARSRSADDFPPLEERRALPTPERTVAPAGAVGAGDAGADAAPSAPALPRMASLDAFGEGDRIADLAAVGLADRTILAWVTYFDSSARPALKPTRPRGDTRAPSATPSKQGANAHGANAQGASVWVRALDQSAEAVGPPTVISAKAESVGGVALAVGQGSPVEVALAWVGKDGGVGQVFVTRLSASGEKQTQRMLSHSKGGCSDVALVATAGGWFVGWIETHDGNADVNMVKIGKDLARIGTEHRVAEAKGEVAELRMLTRGDEVVLAWNEVRTDAALSGVFAARRTSADLTARGDAVRVTQGARHARGLDLGSFDGGAVLAWTEDDPSNLRRTVVLARLDPSLRPLGEPVRPAVPSPSSVALDCGHTCRIVVPAAEQGQLLLYGFAYEGGRSADPPARLGAIPGASTEDISAVLVRDWLFFAEDDLHGGGRVRRAKIVWR